MSGLSKELTTTRAHDVKTQVLGSITGARASSRLCPPPPPPLHLHSPPCIPPFCLSDTATTPTHGPGRVVHMM